MDPNANLDELMERARDIMRWTDDPNRTETELPEDLERVIIAGIRMSELLIALDEWIQNGGFLPNQWRVE